MFWIGLKTSEIRIIFNAKLNLNKLFFFFFNLSMLTIHHNP